MRASYLVTVPVLAALCAIPAAGQMSARLHLDIPIGRRPQIAYGAPRRQLVVREYDAQRFGLWEDYFDEWVPETVYLYDGYYYDYPIDAYAQPIVVYRYRNEFFFAPRQREFIQWRDGRNYRDIGRAYQPNLRNNRGYQAPRGYSGGQYRPAPQDGRNGGNGRQYQAPQDGRNGGNGRQYQAPQVGRNGGNGRQYQAPQNGRNGQNARPAPQGGRNNPPARSGDRSRSRPH